MIGIASKASNQVTIVDITDAYSVIMSSETYTFTGNTQGAPAGLSCSTQIVAFCGKTPCAKVNITASNIKCPTGITASVSGNGTANPTVTFKTTAVIKSTCESTIPVVVDEVTINKKFSFSIAKQGSQGSQGPAGPQGPQGPDGIDSSQIGGRNLLRRPLVTDGSQFGSMEELKTKTFTGWTFSTTTRMSPSIDWSQHIGEPITFRCYIENVSQSVGTGTGILYTFRFSDDSIKQFSSGYLKQGQKGYLTLTANVPSPPSGLKLVRLEPSIRHNTADGQSTVKFKEAKIEFGNKATDWTPAPEDVAEDIHEASKTATNYMKFANNGLTIGNMTGTTLGRNVLIDNDSVDIRKGSTVLASYGDNYVYIGKNNQNATIDFLNGKFKIKQSGGSTVLSTSNSFDIVSNGITNMNLSSSGGFNVNSEYGAIILSSSYTGLSSAGVGGTSARFQLHGKEEMARIYGASLYVEGLITGDLRNNAFRVATYGTIGSERKTLSLVSYDDTTKNIQLGLGGYSNKTEGQTWIYAGKRIYFRAYGDGGDKYFNPYMYKGMGAVTIEILTAGFVTGSYQVRFMIPLTDPVYGSAVPNIADVDGLILRQNGKYTHGSSSSAYIKVGMYEATYVPRVGIRVIAIMDSQNTTNVINNAPIGIQGRLSLSFI